MKSGGIERIEPGTRIGEKYTVLSVLGEGGMGIVVSARDEALDRKVAIKIVRRGLLDDDEAVQRFRLETSALASLKNEHVVRVLDTGSHAGTPFMVMEFLEGADLESIAEERGALPIAEVVSWLLQAIAGLSEAHRAGIVHRDLKPQNLFLARRADGSEHIKVLDFGIAKSVAGGPALTKEGFVMGSPGYMSPEQLQSSRKLDGRTDVWALGAIAYRLLGGRPPFSGRSLEERLGAILTGRRAPLSELRSDVPPELERVIDDCLVPDVNARIPSLGVLADRLAPFAPRAARLPERTPAWKIAAVTLVLLVLTVGVMFLGSGGGAVNEVAARARHADAPLPPLDLAAVDPVAIYPEVQALARSLDPRAELSRIDAEQHVRAGVVDLGAGGAIHYGFQCAASGDEGTSVVQIEVTRDGITGSRFPFAITGKPVPPPTCGGRELWKTAVESGLHPETRAELHYGREPGRATWVVSVPQRPHLRREIDGRTCALSSPAP